MKSAIIPADDGVRMSAWTCSDGDWCLGCYQHRDITNGRGTAEDAARVHVKRIGYTDPVRVHVVGSGRGYTFKAWRGSRGLELREVM